MLSCNNCPQQMVMIFFAMLQRIGKEENTFTNPVCGMSYEEYKEWLKRVVSAIQILFLIPINRTRNFYLQ